MHSDKYLVLVILAVATVVPNMMDLAEGGYRWQMLPAFGASITILLSALGLIKLKIKLPLLFPLLVGLGIVGLVASAILSYLFPIFTFPVPTGQYPVGTISLLVPHKSTTKLVPKSQTDLCDQVAKSDRELVVQIWYPAVKTYGAKSAYLPDPRLIPQGKFSHLGLIKTNAVRDAAIVTADASTYPVIIYSPAWSGFRTDNTFQTEELASHGFVVIGLEHPCAVPMAIYPDGKVIYGTLSAPDYTASDAAMAKFLQVAEAQLNLRTSDVNLVIQELPHINSMEALQGTLNLNKIGIFGHSFGGAVAAQACAIDRRITAGMNMDGLLFGSVAKSGASQPFLFMNSDYPRPTAADLNSTDGSQRRAQQTDAWGYQQRDRWLQQHGGYNLTLLGSTHINFSDYPLRSRLDRGGKISIDRAMKIINEYTVAFFDRELKGKYSALLARQSGSPFPEAVFEHYPKS
jgi:dienelactone hydrolase